MTSYSEYLGNFVTDPKNFIEDPEWYPDIDIGPQHTGDGRERLGIPEGTIDYQRNIKDIHKIIMRFLKKGYIGGVPKNINPELRQHVMYFRANLDAYDQLIMHKVFSRDELYFRCLNEGPDFLSFIKKSRQYSLQNKIGIGNSNIPDEYVHEEYSGYDSILHERYLIYWDDTDITDYYYSLLPEPEIDTTDMVTYFHHLANKYGIFDREHKPVSFINKIANKRTYTQEKNKTTELKNAWALTESDQVFMAVRKVVPVEPGSTRDTGVPDVYSLNKLKVLHELTRDVLEKLPYSANCSFKLMNKRLARLRRKSVFTHLDFKKFGLLFPRQVPNKILDLLDAADLKITDLYLETEDGHIKTKRGGILGWFDALVSIGTISILYGLASRMGWTDFDMLQFNDDIEVGFDDISESEIQRRQEAMCTELERFGFFMSWKKIYSSRTSVFLEDYEPRDTDLDLTKIQLAVKPFAKALCTTIRSEAKMNFAHGANFGYTTWLKEEIMRGFEPLYPEEYSAPLELGGWKGLGFGGLNTALEDASIGELRYFMAMKKYKEPHLAKKTEWLNLDDIFRRRMYNIQNATGPVVAVENKLEFDDPIRTLPDEELFRQAYESEEEIVPPTLPPRLPPRREEVRENMDNG